MIGKVFVLKYDSTLKKKKLYLLQSSGGVLNGAADEDLV